MSTINAFKSIIQLLLACSLLFLYALPLNAADGSKSESAGKYEILESIKSRHQNIDSIKAAVYQDKQLSMLNKPVHVEGTIVLQRPGKLRWETFVPEKSIVVINMKTITKYYPDSGEAEIHNLSDNFIAQNTMRFFSSIMWGAVEDMDGRFSVEIVEDNDEVIVALTPLSKMVAKYLSSVLIFYNGATGMPQGFSVSTPKGDKTVTRLADVVMGEEVSRDTFELILPADVRVRDYTETVDFN